MSSAPHRPQAAAAGSVALVRGSTCPFSSRTEYATGGTRDDDICLHCYVNLRGPSCCTSTRNKSCRSPCAKCRRVHHQGTVSGEGEGQRRHLRRRCVTASFHRLAVLLPVTQCGKTPRICARNRCRCCRLYREDARIRLLDGCEQSLLVTPVCALAAALTHEWKSSPNPQRAVGGVRTRRCRDLAACLRDVPPAVRGHGDGSGYSSVSSWRGCFLTSTCHAAPLARLQARMIAAHSRPGHWSRAGRFSADFSDLPLYVPQDDTIPSPTLTYIIASRACPCFPSPTLFSAIILQLQRAQETTPFAQLVCLACSQVLPSRGRTWYHR